MEFIEAVEEKYETVMGRLEEVYKHDRPRLSVLAIEIIEAVLCLGDLATLVLELYGDCVVKSELRNNRLVILKKIQRLAEKNANLKALFKRLYNLESGANKKE
ncbi:unnamed protein product [Gongylonema pulchrum]|uniref:DED domain-containing protein n=1 Tax=Gongylonema pulchrum TaxID=637853 RepID=A0A183ERL3_9BILA|nr:unnamed protein product [Gongylonema pulchrum]